MENGNTPASEMTKREEIALRIYEKICPNYLKKFSDVDISTRLEPYNPSGYAKIAVDIADALLTQLDKK